MTNSRQNALSTSFLKNPDNLINSTDLFLASPQCSKKKQRLLSRSQSVENVSNKQLVAAAVSCDALLLTELFFKSLRKVGKNFTHDFVAVKNLIQNNNIV